MLMEFAGGPPGMPSFASYILQRIWEVKYHVGVFVTGVIILNWVLTLSSHWPSFLTGDRVQPISVSGLACCPDSQEQTGSQLGPAEHGELGGTFPVGPQLPTSSNL